MQKPYNTPHLSHSHCNCTPEGGNSVETQARTHPETRTEDISGLAQRETTLKVVSACGRVKNHNYVNVISISKTTPISSTYHMTFLYAIIQGIFLVTTDCSSLYKTVQQIPFAVHVCSNTQILSHNIKTLKSFPIKQVHLNKPLASHFSFSEACLCRAMLFLKALYWLFLRLEEAKALKATACILF